MADLIQSKQDSPFGPCPIRAEVAYCNRGEVGIPTNSSSADKPRKRGESREGRQFFGNRSFGFGPHT